MVDGNDFNDSNVITEKTELLNDGGNRKTLKLCIFFGPRVPYIHVKSVYLLLVIIALQRFYFYNTTSILQSLLSYYYDVFDENKYLLGVLTYMFFIISPIFGYIADRHHWNRTKIVLFSIILGIVASLFILATLIIQYTSQKQDTYGFVNKHNYTCTALHTNSSSAIAECYSAHVCIIIGLLFFSLHYAIFFPYSIVYGLDLLEGTPQASYCLFFPMVYIAINIGALFQYMNYYSFNPTLYLFHFCLIFFVLILAFSLFILGMCFKIFSESDRIHNQYSFSVSIKIIWRAIKIRVRYGRPKAKVSFLYLAATGLNPLSRDDVERTIHFFKLNLILFLILPLLSVDQAMASLFTQQDNILRSEFRPLPENNSILPSDYSYYCKPVDSIISYLFVNSIVAVLFTISMEYFYYKITFDFKPNMVFFLKCLKKDSKFRFTNAKKMLHGYFHFLDPIRKKLFFSFPFGLLTLFFGLAVDRVSQSYISNISCNLNSNYSVRSYSLSQIPLSAQIPQYVFAAMMEAIYFIYIYQYIMYVCAKYFQNSMRAFFISLYSFYFGLGGIAINSINALLAYYCDHSTCKYCIIYTHKCYSKTSSNDKTYTWIIWAIMLVLLSINMVAFFILIHYKQIKTCCRRDRKSVTSEPDINFMNSSNGNY